MQKYGIVFFVLVFAFSACKNPGRYSGESPEIPEHIVKTGIDVLQENNFKILEHKKVALVSNPTGVNRNLESTVDILHKAQNVNLVALFGPEHGIRGNYSAGDHVEDQVDDITGLPVYSLYGKNRSPLKDVAENIDVFVYDIQDIGSRSYTYISTMGKIMEQAADLDKEVVILDRPNPLGGERIEGSLVEENYYSFVSQFNIPYIYGLTCGELAMLLNEEGLLTDQKKCTLTIVPMKGWKRSMTFEETGLEWIPTSPHIPHKHSPFFYSATGIIGELDPNLIGIGYTLPFQTLAANWIDADDLAAHMNGLNLPGVLFRPIYFKPYYMKKAGEELQGVQIHITDYQMVNLTEIQFYFLEMVHKIHPDKNLFELHKDRWNMFDKVCGSNKVREIMMQTHSVDALKKHWNKDVIAFQEISGKYHLYK